MDIIKYIEDLLGRTERVSPPPSEQQARSPKTRVSSNVRSMMHDPTVQACVGIIAEALASMDMEVRRYDSTGARFERATRWGILEEPHAHLSRFEFWEQVVRRACLQGVCVLRIVRLGQLAQRFEITDYTEPVYDAEHVTIGGFSDGEKYVPLLDLLRDPARVRKAATSNTLESVKNAISKLAVRKREDAVRGRRTKESDQAKAATIAYYDQAVEDAGRFVYLDAEEIKAIDAQVPDLSQAIGASEAHICQVFRMPVAVVRGEVTNAHQLQAMFSLAIMPWVRKVEAALSQKLTRQRRTVVALDSYYYRLSLLEASGRAGYYSTLHQLGVFTPNEIREHEGLPFSPSPLADLHVQNLSWANEAQLQGRQPLKPEPVPTPTEENPQ